MRLKLWLVMSLFVVFVAGSAVAQDPSKQEMTAEEKAMMEAWQKTMNPGPAHKLLNDMVGKWSAKVTSVMSPGAPPMVSKGTADSSWVFGGRYVKQSFSGTMMGTPFQGVGYTGYDNVKKHYWGTWMDSMSTGIMMTTGSTDDGGKTWKFTGTMTDPMGNDQKIEEKVVVHNKNHHTFEMWGPAPDGTMFKMMEIEYTRKK